MAPTRMSILFYLLLMQMTQPFQSLVNTFKVFLCFFELEPKINKCEIAGLVILKRAQEAVCGL